MDPNKAESPHDIMIEGDDQEPYTPVQSDEVMVGTPTQPREAPPLEIPKVKRKLKRFGYYQPGKPN